MGNELRNGGIVIPAYKPNGKLTDIVRALANEFRTVIVVDDGSGKEYQSIFDEIEYVLSNSSVTGKILHHQVNMGKGNALKTAFDYILTINKDLASDDKIAGIVTVDADGQHKIEDIIKVYEMLEDNPDKLILGCRTFDDKVIPMRSRFGNTLTHHVFKWCCGIDVSDTQTGLRGIPMSFLKECCEIRGERYEYETNMLLNAKNVGIEFIETKIDTIYEQGNPSSHFNPFVDSLSIYRIIFTYSLSSLLSWLIDIVVFMVCTWIGLPVIISNYAGRALSALANYNINKKVVFRNKNKSWITLIRYIMLLIFSGTVSAGLIIIIRRFLPVSVGFIKIVVELVLYFVNYYVQHTFVFDNKKQEVTDWTAYYKKKRSFFSTFTQKATLRILKRYIDIATSSLNAGERRNGFSLLELGGGNSCFADELCDKCKIDKYDIIDNNKYAVKLFKEKQLPIEHEAFCINLLEELEKDIQQYDFVYSIGLIEHFLGDDISKVIEQHFVRAKNGGVVLITFPTPTIKYRFVRGIMEVLGVWQFADENPLKFEEVKDVIEKNGIVETHFLNSKLPLTQYVVVAKKK